MQKHCFCVAKTLARLDRANDFPRFLALNGVSNNKKRKTTPLFAADFAV
ncbi:hypothetical protein CGSMWGv00703C2mash_00185 [Gardnerella pickettii 00703C2mash]|nr:hypothetical protein CGSMWGv00703C2mash_00185 [Gardnerella pickettii 00703C2mash]